MNEYVNPKYAALLREFRATQREAAHAGRTVPVRAFITAKPTPGK